MLQLKNQKGDVLYEADVDTWQGHVFPKDLDLDYLHVENNMTFTRATFQGQTTFRHATFDGVVSFDHVTFTDDVIFRDTLFKNTANFNNSKFLGTAMFWGTVFKGITTFNNTAFMCRLDCDDIRCKSAISFSDATIAGSFTCHNAVFEDMAFFQDTEFEGYTYFTNATFVGSAVFSGASFKHVPSDFPREIIPSLGEGELTIRGMNYVTT